MDSTEDRLSVINQDGINYIFLAKRKRVLVYTLKYLDLVDVNST